MVVFADDADPRMQGKGGQGWKGRRLEPPPKKNSWEPPDNDLLELGVFGPGAVLDEAGPLMIRGQIGMGHAHLSTAKCDSSHAVCYCIPRHVWDKFIAEKDVQSNDRNIDFLYRQKEQERQQKMERLMKQVAPPPITPSPQHLQLMGRSRRSTSGSSRSSRRRSSRAAWLISSAPPSGSSRSRSAPSRTISWRPKHTTTA